MHEWIQKKVQFPALLVSTFALLMSFDTVTAAQVDYQPSISQTLSYDDNFILSASDAEGTIGYVLEPQLLLLYKTPAIESTLSGKTSLKRYSQLPRFNTEGYGLSWLGLLKTSERLAFNVAISHQLSAARDTAESDSGDFTTTDDLVTQSLAPGFTYSLDERNDLSLGASYLNEDRSGNTANDTRTSSVSLSWLHRYSPLITTSLASSYESYRSTGVLGNNKSDYVRVTGGVQYDISERFSMDAKIGYRKVNSESGSSENAGTGSLLSMALSYNYLIDSLSLSLMRDLSPSSDGSINEQDRIEFGWSRSLTEKSVFGLNLAWQETESTNSRDNVTISTDYSYSLTQDLRLELDYTFNRQRQDIGGSAKSNAVLLSVQYYF